MRKVLFLATVILTFGLASTAIGQEVPQIPDNATPVDNNIKLRSVELERVKREAEKAAMLRRDNGTELNFSIVKKDFEGIQKEQMRIIDAYTKGKKIDYKKISKSAAKITEMAIRLRANVFEPDDGDKKSDEGKDNENPFAGKTVRDLIIALDNAIGEVVTSPMWQKLAVVDPGVAGPVDKSLVKVIDTSGALWLESTKLKKR